MTYLDFERERDRATTSWERANPRAAMIERSSPVDYVVTLRDGDAHAVVYARERGAFVGWCDCRGFQYRDDDASPCAHLSTLRKAEWMAKHDPSDAAGRDALGEPIEARDSAALESDHGSETQPELRADGRGELEHVAGSDGREFGRPASRL